MNKKPSTLKRIYDHSFYLWIVIIGMGLLAQTFRSANMTKEREASLRRHPPSPSGGSGTSLLTRS